MASTDRDKVWKLEENKYELDKILEQKMKVLQSDIAHENVPSNPDVLKRPEFRHLRDLLMAKLKRKFNAKDVQYELQGSRRENTFLPGSDYDYMEIINVEDTIKVREKTDGYATLVRISDGVQILPDKYTKDMISCLQTTVNETVKQTGDAGFKIHENGPAISLEAHIPRGPNKLLSKVTLDFALALKVYGESKVFICKSRVLATDPSKQGGLKPAQKEMFRESFSSDEVTKMDGLKTQAKSLLQFMKFLKKRNSQLAGLQSYHFKNVIFYLYDTPRIENRTAVTGDAFLAFLEKLLEFLHKGEMKWYFCPKVNLLDWMSDQQIREIRNFVSQLIAQPSARSMFTLLEHTM